MDTLFMLLGVVAYIVSVVGSIIILIDAFKNEIWKGVLSLLCGIYFLIYMFTEFESEHKWAVIACTFLGSIAGFVFMSMAGGI